VSKKKAMTSEKASYVKRKGHEDAREFAIELGIGKEFRSDPIDIFELNLSSIYRKKMNELSGGMRQKILLIFALLGNPKILLLDEPFSHLDTSAQEKLFDFLQNSDSTLLISTHRIQDVSFATRVIYMKNGRVENDEKKK
jgi:ABC-type multidrug transport system ATPase subunit